MPGAGAVVAGSVSLLPDASDCAAVVTPVVVAVLACTAAIACAATAVGFTAVSFMPGAATAFAFALPLFAATPPLPTVFELPAFDVFGVGPEPKSELPLFPAEPLDGADVCGAACGELPGWFVAAGGGLGG